MSRILLVESGPRHLLEGILPHLASGSSFDLLTCFPGLPAGLAPEATWRVADYRDSASRRRLFRQLRARNYSALVILCAGVPIMTRWKWAAALRLRARLLIVNENGDCFWLTWANWRIARHFLLFRSGLSGANAARTLARLLLFPFTLSYLLLYAAFLHTRRGTARMFPHRR